MQFGEKGTEYKVNSVRVEKKTKKLTGFIVLNILEELKNSTLVRRILSFESEQLQIGLEGIVAHKLRAFLTMLGIIFGVAAVISMLAIGEGARRQALSQIQSLGLNNIIIEDVNEPDSQENEPGILLNRSDADAIQEILTTVQSVTPVVEREYQATYKDRVADITLTGSESKYFNVMNLTIDRGGYFTVRENNLYHRVCVLGSDIADELFTIEDPLGQSIKIEKQWFTVVGVLKYQPVSTAGTSDLNLNNHIFVPINSILIRYDNDPVASELDQIIVQISESKYVIASSEIIEEILYRRHNKDKNYKLIVPEQLLRQSEETQNIFNIVMGAIAGISLLVGGIGIMNIMLASVLERTREIGIRRSLGATQHDIRNQFLIESTSLSLFGGIVGILFGYILAYSVTIFSDWETAISLWSIVLSFGVSSGVGIAFGYYPAKKASELNPIDALRYE